MRKIKIALPVLLWLLALLPFFLGAPAAHPATDDFTFALYTHPTWEQTHSLPHVLKDAVSYALRTWRDWQGTFTGIVIMTLNPIVFSLEHYGVHAVILLLLNLIAWYAFFAHMLGRRMGLDRRLCWLLYGALSAMLLVFLPDIVEGIYWFNGAWFYMGAQAAALLTLVLCDRVSESEKTGAKLAMPMALCALLLFALGMDNYITAMMTAAALFMMACQRAYARDRRAAIRTALFLLPVGVGLLLSVIAPGNSVRMERDGAYEGGPLWMLSSILWTMRDAVKYIVRFLVKTPLLALLLVFAPALAARVKAKKGCPPIWATILGAYLILCAMIIPHMYSSGYAGSGRVVNMYHCYVLCVLPLVLVMALMRMSDAQRARIAGAKRLCALLGAAALALCLALGQIGNYIELVSDQVTGEQAQYIAQIQNEYALCEAGGESDDVALPPWQVYTVTGKPTAYEDAAMWTNEAMAQYFGVRSLYVQP